MRRTDVVDVNSQPLTLARPLVVWLLATSLAWGQAEVGQDSAVDDDPRDMLRIMKIDDSQLRFLQDDRPLVEDESETLLRLLFRLPQFAQVDVERWSRPINQWQQLLDDTASLRFELFDLRGYVVKVRKRNVLPELIPRLLFRQYFELTIQTGNQLSLVLTRSIPQAWQDVVESEAPFRQAVRLHAMLLKRVAVDGQPGLVFAASRVRWHPEEVSPELGIRADQILLGQLGLDIARLEEVQHNTGMQGQDRECFYQSLAAVRLAEPGQLAKVGRREFDISRMIKTPAQVAGELYTLQGRARRAVLIHVEDADIQRRFNIDHYYEIEVFVALEKNVRFVDPNDPEDKVFTDFPFVVCVPELPQGMETGDDIHEPISFSAFFVKLWAYRTEFMTGDQSRPDRPRLQLSPLLIGPTVTSDRQEIQQNPFLGLTLAILFILSLLTIWFVLWRASIGDRQFQRTRLFRKYDVEGDQLRSFNDA